LTIDVHQVLLLYKTIGADKYNDYQKHKLIKVDSTDIGYFYYNVKIISH
jgi:hypothetical protein